MWGERADATYDVLVDRFWCPLRGLFRVSTRRRLWPFTSWNYWWQAQALDVIVDAVERGRAGERDRARRLVDGIRRRNRGITNSFYDDMAWLALALGRARVVGVEVGGLVDELWRAILVGWVPEFGCLYWRRGDGYMNAPANGPGAILAVRRYQAGGDVADLDRARSIVAWLDATLVDPVTGVVSDGINPTVDRGPNRDRYTYNQGTVAGANLALYQVTGDEAYRERALLVGRAAGPGVLPDEGGGDRGLFKGIYARYAAQLDDPGIRATLEANGESAWAARGPTGLSGPSWTSAPGDDVELSAHLSALHLFGTLAG